MKELPLHLGANARNGAGTDHGLALQRVGNRPQERVAQIGIERPGGSHDGVKFGIG
jgi:hypothetical protein